MSIYANQNDALSSEIQTTNDSVEPINTTPAYVYRLICKPTGQFYYGYRYSNINKYRMPEDDLWIYYFASSDPVDELIEIYGKDSFDYKVIFQSTDIDQTYWFEQTIIKAYWGNPKLLNQQYKDKTTGMKRWAPAVNAAKKAVETRKTRGTDIIATQKMVETRRKNGSYTTGAKKAAATRKATGADKIASMKRSANQRASGSAKRGARKAIETKRRNGSLHRIAQKSAATRKAKGLDKIINEKAVATKKEKGIYAQSGKKAAATRKEKGLDKIINEKAVATKQANGIYHAGGIKAAETRTKRGKDTLHSQYWQLTKPDGEVIVIQNLEKFCRENGLSSSCMSMVSAGKKSNHKGWKCMKMVKQYPLPEHVTDELKDN